MLLNDIKQNLRLTFPILLTRLLGIASNLIVMVIIARLGETALSASALVMSIFSVCILLVMAFGFSVCAVIAQANAHRQPQQVGDVVRSSLMLNTLLGIPFLAVFYFMTPLLNALHQPPEVSRLVGLYFYGLIPGYLTMLWAGVLEQFLIGISKPRYLVYLSILNIAIMPLTSYALVFGVGSLPAMGMLGAGYAVSLSAFASLFFLLGLIILKRWHVHYQLFSFAQATHHTMMKKLAQLGWPIALQFAGEFAAYTLMTLMMGWIGLIALAAQQILMQFVSVTVMIPTSVSQATAVLVGQARGTEPARINACVNSAILIVLSMMIVIGIAYLVFPEALANIYLEGKVSQREAILSLTTTFLAITALSQCFDGVRNVLAGAYRGLQQTKTPMLIGTASLWLISLPLAYIAGFMLHGGAIGIRLGFMAGVIIATLALLIRWYGSQPSSIEFNWTNNQQENKICTTD